MAAPPNSRCDAKLSASMCMSAPMQSKQPSLPPMTEEQKWQAYRSWPRPMPGSGVSWVGYCYVDVKICELLGLPPDVDFVKVVKEYEEIHGPISQSKG